MEDSSREEERRRNERLGLPDDWISRMGRKHLGPFWLFPSGDAIDNVVVLAAFVVTCTFVIAGCAYGLLGER